MSLPPGRFVASQEYLLDFCPHCGKAKHAYYNVNKRVGMCHHCQERLFDLGDSCVLSRPAFHPLGPDSGEVVCAADHYRARNYLAGRMVPQELMRRVPLLWSSSRRNLLVDLDPLSFELPALRLRRSLCDDARWVPETVGCALSLYGFGLRFLPAARKRVLVVEGVFDVLSPGLLGYAVALLGTRASDAWLCWLERMEQVTIWLDPDFAGRKGAQELFWALTHRGVSCSVLHHVTEPGDTSTGHSMVREVKEVLSSYEVAGAG